MTSRETETCPLCAGKGTIETYRYVPPSAATFQFIPTKITCAACGVELPHANAAAHVCKFHTGYTYRFEST